MVALFIGLVAYLVGGVTVCAIAFVLGGNDERTVAKGLLLAAFATQLASVFGGTHWDGANWGVIAVDAAFFVWLAAVACRSVKFWPMWAAASQLAGTVAHVPAILIPGFDKRLYLFSQPIWVVPLLAAILIGSLSASRATTRTHLAAE